MRTQSTMCGNGWDELPCDYNPKHTDITPITLSSFDDDYDEPPEVCEMPEDMVKIYERPLREDEYNDDDHRDDRSLEEKFVAFLLCEEYRLEPLGSHLTRQYRPSKAPPYFKRDHPDDDLFLKQLGDTQVPWRTQLKYPKHADEPLIKDVVAFIIWQDTKHASFWKKLRKMSPPDQDDSLYSHMIRAAASLLCFLYTQANLFKIGHKRTSDKQMDKIFTKAEKWSRKGTPIDEACKLLVQLTANKDEFSFVTENHLADLLCYYAIDIRYKNFERPPTVKVNLHPEDKDQLFDDITKEVRKVELPPTELKADEYTHWMMMLLREEVTQVEENLIFQAIGDNPMAKLPRPSEDNNPMINRDRPSEDALLSDLFTLLIPLFVKAKDKMKQELLDVVQPFIAIGRLHQCIVCAEISETIQIADLRRMSLGSRFIGRSHLIWAFYKLGYALPLEIRNTMISLSDSDEDHPPYHFYIAALKLALCSGEKKIQLDHFIYAVLNLEDIDVDGKQWTEFFLDFKVFQKDLDSMETEVEPKSTVTVRPCGSLDVFSDSSDDSQERTTDFEPSSSENSSTATWDAEENII